MRVARSHPLLGWLRLDGHTYSRTLDQSLRERDRALDLDRNHSGHAEGFVDWVWTTQPSVLLCCCWEKTLLLGGLQDFGEPAVTELLLERLAPNLTVEGQDR